MHLSVTVLACDKEEEKLEAEHVGKGRVYHCWKETETNQVLLVRHFKGEDKKNVVVEYFRY